MSEDRSGRDVLPPAGLPVGSFGTTGGHGDGPAHGAPPVSDAELISQYPAIGTARVVDRDWAVPYRTYSTSEAVPFDPARVVKAPRSSDEAWSQRITIVRPVVLHFERIVKGDLPSCLTLAVPGGHVDLFWTGSSYPAPIRVGDRFMVFFSQLEREDGLNGMVASHLEAVGPGGLVALPFGTHTLVHPDEWDGSPPHYVRHGCGISTNYLDRLWLPEQPVPEEVSMYEWRWSFPTQVGFIKSDRSDVAEFTAVGGQKLRFAPAPPGMPDPNEGCEVVRVVSG